jgi:hypothetical protein
MKLKFSVAILVFTAAVAAIITIYCINEPDDSHLSIRYQLWKHGYQPFRDGFKGAFMADSDRDSMVIGKTREELGKSFSPLSYGKRNEKYWGDTYVRFRQNDQFVWLWGTNWLVVLRDGRAICVNYIKG